MANTIKHKRGSGSNPAASDLAVGELAIRTDTGVVFTKKDDGTVAEIAGGGDTDLGVSTTSTAVTVTSSTGNNATISEASGSAAGVMSVAHHDKLDGIESNATADQTATEILTALKTVDGAGSGLDAAALEGLGAGSFIRSNADDTVSGHTEWQDNKEVRLGNSADLKLYHDATDGFIENNTNHLVLRNNANDKDIYLQTDDGSGSTTNYIKCDGSTGDVVLYQYGSQKLQTFSSGVDITGELQCDSLDVDGNGDIAGELTVNRLKVDDDGSSGPTVQIRTDDASPWALQISNDSWSSGDNRGFLTFQANDGTVYQRVQGVSDNWEAYYIQQNNGSTTNIALEISTSRAVKLRYQGAQKFSTKSDGVDITGELECDSLDVDGASSFDGIATFNGNYTSFNNNGYIRGDSSGVFQLQAGSSNVFRFMQGNNTTKYVEINSGGLNPGADDTYDLGTSSVQWRNAYFDGTVNADALDVDGAANITGNVDINGDIRHNGDTNCLFGFPANDTFRISTGGTERFRITSTGAIAIEGSSNYGTSGQVLTSNGNDAPTWQDGGGTVASGCVYENSQTISANYSVTSGKNAMSAGPITIASGVTVTVTSGSTYTIV